MSYYAVIEDNIVTNTIIADSKEIAEEIIKKPCIEYNEENGAGIGDTYDGVRFIKPQPYPSWILNSEYKWNPPVEIPVIEENSSVYYEWDESTVSWNAIPITEE